MNRFGFGIWIVLLCFLPCTYLPAQNSLVEICNNAVDDDADGLIDLNDPDCDCPMLRPKSLLPNSSFEELDCCPTGHSTIGCARFWTQASHTTPDLYHPCGYHGVGAPQPLPAGEGFIGFIDGVFTGKTKPNWKEYIGTCLEQPLKADTIYRLQFYMGFIAAHRSPMIELTVFGASNCNDLPFGDDDVDFGCPSNDPNWTNIGSISADGVNQWRSFNMLLTPNKVIRAVAIGPSCSPQSLTNDSYYYLDDLLLTKRDQELESVEIQATDELCSPTFTLELPLIEARTYQWYRNGIALVEETGHSISYPLDEGLYTVRVIDEDGSCYVTDPYKLSIPYKYTKHSDTFCEGDFYNFGNAQLDKEGTYFDTLQSTDLCDSIIKLELEMISEISSNQTVKIQQGHTYKVGGKEYDLPGTYEITLPSSEQCDSIIMLTLSNFEFYIPNIFSPNGDGHNDYFTITKDADLKTINNLNIYDRWGFQVYKQSNTSSINSKGWNGNHNGTPVNPGIYTYVMLVTMSDESQIFLSGMITLIR